MLPFDPPSTCRFEKPPQKSQGTQVVHTYFLQLYRKNENGYPHFYLMISITEMLPFNEKKIGKNLCSVYWQFHDQRRRKLGHEDKETLDLGPLQRANALGCCRKFHHHHHYHHHLFISSRNHIYKLYSRLPVSRKVKRILKLQLLYYYMRNFCNLIGLEQWYFSLI